MSVATKLGIAYSSYYCDPYYTKRELTWADYSSKRLTDKGGNSWLHSLLSSPVEPEKEKPAHTIQEELPVHETVELSCEGNKDVIETPGGDGDTTKKIVENENLIERPALVNLEDNALKDEKTGDNEVPIDITSDSVVVNATSVENEVPPPAKLSANVEVADISVSAHPLTRDAQTEPPVFDDDPLGASQDETRKFDAVSELKGMIPVTCLNEVIDCIMRKIQEQNIKAVALDDMNRTIAENFEVPETVEKNKRQASKEVWGSNKIHSSVVCRDPEEGIKQELAIHLYSLRDQVKQLQKELDAREAKQKLAHLRQKNNGNQVKKITVEIVKGYEEDPVPYVKPPFTLANLNVPRDKKEEHVYEDDFVEEVVKTPRPRERQGRRRKSSRTSSSVTSSSSLSTTSSSSSTISSSISSSISSRSTPPKRIRSARKRASTKDSSSSSSFKSESLSSSSSVSRVSLDEAAAVDFWNKKTNLMGQSKRSQISSTLTSTFRR